MLVRSAVHNNTQLPVLQHRSCATIRASMPRIPPCLLRRANHQSPNLAALVPACRNIPSARDELRWITEHVHETVQTGREAFLAKLCRARGQGVPLQYLLGSQPFGHLDIKCKPGVLIPRSETEAYTCHLVDLIKRGRLHGIRPSPGCELNVIDLCTGTGCIPVLLFSQLQSSFPSLKVRGVDVSPEAVELARENINWNMRLGHINRFQQGHSLQILRGDIFSDEALQTLTGIRWDLLVSNPPYVSQRTWDNGHGQLSYSVRKYEPRLALVPGNHLPVPDGWLDADVFYSRLLDIASLLRPKYFLMELGDEVQARRVLNHLIQLSRVEKSKVELWRDWPDMAAAKSEDTCLKIATASGQIRLFPVRGAGHIRCIFIRLNQDVR